MSHRSNALAAGAVAAALAAGLTVPALAHDTRATHDGSAAAEHADSRAAHQRFAMTFVTLGRRDRPTRVVAAGPLAQALTAETLSETFELPLQLTADDGRYAARAL